MASVLRRPMVDSERVHDTTPPLLVDPDWQSLLDEAADRAYQEGYEAGRVRGEEEARGGLERVNAGMERAVEAVRTDLEAARRESAGKLLSTALDLIERLTGELRPDPETLQSRIEAALAELDGTDLQVLVSPEHAELLKEGLSSDSRVEVVDDPSLQPGEARISSAWADADLTWQAVLGVLREALDA